MKESETVQEPQHTKAHATWPGAFGIFKQSKAAIMNNLWLIIGLVLGYIVVSGIIDYSLTANDDPFDFTTRGSFINSLVSLILGSIATIVWVHIIMRSIKGRKLALGESFEKVDFETTIKMIGLNIVVFLLLFLSVLAFVIPFFFVLPRLVLASYFLVEKNTGVLDAVKLSWDKTKGSSMKVWGIIGATLVMILPALTIIGIPVAIYLVFMYSAAYGLLYLFLNGKPPITKEYVEPEPAYPKS